MPVYGYACGRCGFTYEALVRSSEERAACPSCGSKRTTQLPVLRTAIRTSMGRQRRVIDMSSGLCPCGCGKARHVRAG